MATISLRSTWALPLAQRRCWLRQAAAPSGSSQGDEEIGEVQAAPAADLGAVGEVGVLDERVVLPAARVRDGGRPPHAARAGEVDEEAGAAAHGVLEAEMRVEEDGLHAGEERRLAVQVQPPTLHEREPRVGEVGHGAAEEVALRDEVGVEDGDDRPAASAPAL
jgi:hypothetical protein